MGKNSFIIYFFHPVLFYIMLRIQISVEAKIDNFMDTNSVTEKMDTLEGDNLMENTSKAE